MSIITRMRKQKAVYWERLTVGSFAESTYKEPVEVDCRWDDVLFEVVTENKETVMSSATVYLDRPPVNGSYILLGTLQSSHSDTPVTSSRLIIRTASTPNLKATEFLRVAYLQ